MHVKRSLLYGLRVERNDSQAAVFSEGKVYSSFNVRSAQDAWPLGRALLGKGRTCFWELSSWWIRSPWNRHQFDSLKYQATCLSVFVKLSSKVLLQEFVLLPKKKLVCPSCRHDLCEARGWFRGKDGW